MSVLLDAPRRWAKAQSTVAHWLGLPAKPYGFYLPYRHAAAVEPLDEGESVGWLERRFEAAAPGMESLLRRAEGFNGCFKEFEFAHPARSGRPRFDQDWFPGLDGALAYALTRLRRPRRIVEIGSGHSTRFLAAAIRDEGLDTRLHSIDPKPRREIDGLCAAVTRAPLSRAHDGLITGLEAGDFLFIDSSHVAQPGTDADRLIGELLPTLAPGVVVHIHDVFLPFGYPADWRWRGYNEQNAVLAMLGGGDAWSVLAANAWLRRRRPEAAARVLAPCPKGAREASLWLERR